MARHQLVDEGVGDMRREQSQKLRGPGRGQFRIHGLGGYPKENNACRLFGPSHFLAINNWLITTYAEFPDTIYHSRSVIDHR